MKQPRRGAQRHTPLSDKQRAEAVELYACGIGPMSIAVRVGSSHFRVLETLHSEGVIRPTDNEALVELRRQRRDHSEAAVFGAHTPGHDRSWRRRA